MKIIETLSLGSVSVKGNVVENVKVLGLDSRNGRHYLAEAVKKALPKYEGKWVYLNHALRVTLTTPGSPLPARDIEDKFARLRNVRQDDTGGIRAELAFNPKHPFTPTFLGWLETDTEALGLSHSVEGLMRHDTKTNRDIVYEITDVESVDLVSDPATTKGLYESMDPMTTMPPAEDAGYATKVGELIQAIMIDASLDGAAKKAKVLTLLNLMDETIPAEEEDKEGEKLPGEEKENDEPVDESTEDDIPSEDEDSGEEEDAFRKKKEAFQKMEKRLGDMLVKLDQKIKLLEDKKPHSLPPASPKTGKPISVDTFVANLMKGGK